MGKMRQIKHHSFRNSKYGDCTISMKKCLRDTQGRWEGERPAWQSAMCKPATGWLCVKFRKKQTCFQHSILLCAIALYSFVNLVTPSDQTISEFVKLALEKWRNTPFTILVFLQGWHTMSTFEYLQERLMSASVPAAPARQEAPRARRSFPCVAAFLHSRRRSLLERNGWNFAGTTETNMRWEINVRACSALIMGAKNQTKCWKSPLKSAHLAGRCPDRGTTGSSRESSCYGCCCPAAACRSDSKSHPWTDERQMLFKQRINKDTCVIFKSVTWGCVWRWHIPQWCGAFRESSAAGPGWVLRCSWRRCTPWQSSAAGPGPGSLAQGGLPWTWGWSTTLSGRPGGDTTETPRLIT